MSTPEGPRADAQVTVVDPQWDEPARAALSWVFGFGLYRSYDADEAQD